MILLADMECVTSDTGSDMAVGRRLTGEGIFGQAVFLSLPSTPPRRFVTHPRPIFTRVQNGAGDRKLCVFQGFFRDKNTHKPPASRLP